jgi:hypothetical protein
MVLIVIISSNIFWSLLPWLYYIFSIKGALLLEVSNITSSICIAKMHTTVYESSIEAKTST